MVFGNGGPYHMQFFSVFIDAGPFLATVCTEPWAMAPLKPPLYLGCYD